MQLFIHCQMYTHIVASRAVLTTQYRCTVNCVDVQVHKKPKNEPIKYVENEFTVKPKSNLQHK